mgnify:FL=1
MSFYHFTIDNRESILIYRMQGLNAKLSIVTLPALVGNGSDI